MNLLYANDRRGAYPDSWYAATAIPPGPYAPLGGDRRADVCIVGGGFTGLSAALHLARRGADVVLIEAQRVGFGASGRNGGQVNSGLRQEQPDLERRYGMDAARALWTLAEEAKTLLRDLIGQHRIDARWRPGVAQTVYSTSELDDLNRLTDHMAATYGYDRTEPLDRTATAELIGSTAFAGGVLDWGAGHIHPLRMAFGLARAAAAAGASLHEGTEATRIRPATPGQPARVETPTGTVTADHVIVAANGYHGGLDRQTAARVLPINSFVLATEPLTERAPEILTRDVAAVDTLFVVNYWRKTEDGRLLFGGGESYGDRFPPDIAATVRRPMLRIYPQLADARIDHAWGGTLGITSLRLPFFGRPAPGVWAAAGFSGQGVALATLAGRLLSDAIHGETAGFDTMAAMAPPPFPGGSTLRRPILTLAMLWFSLRDRLGV